MNECAVLEDDEPVVDWPTASSTFAGARRRAGRLICVLPSATGISVGRRGELGTGLERADPMDRVAAGADRELSHIADPREANLTGYRRGLCQLEVTAYMESIASDDDELAGSLDRLRADRTRQRAGTLVRRHRPTTVPPVTSCTHRETYRGHTSSRPSDGRGYGAFRGAIRSRYARIS